MRQSRLGRSLALPVFTRGRRVALGTPASQLVWTMLVQTSIVVCVTLASAPISGRRRVAKRRPRRHFDSPQQEAFLNLWRTYDRLRAHEPDVELLSSLATLGARVAPAK